MFDKLSDEWELFRKMRVLIKQAEVEARLAGSHMVEAGHLPRPWQPCPSSGSRSRRLRNHDETQRTGYR